MSLFDEMSFIPRAAHWEKPQGKNPPLAMSKRFEIVGRGVALVIGCATFPTWNTYPGLFAALASGNAVIVKPHPASVLAAAITVRIVRAVLAENGIDPNLVTLAAVDKQETTKTLALHPQVKSIDYTGGPAFGRWLLTQTRTNAPDRQIYAELSGVNNQSAAFSDFHATGANPAANASYADSAFVANRFRVVQRRQHV
jgi:acyl-CoA reductase-like NAD-dependent aldehyde dehydrogenase